MTLLELAERVEAAAGPDLDLDLAIGEAVGSWPAGPGTFKLPKRYSRSLDAAMTLVPEGWLVKHLSQLDFDEGWQCQMMRPIGYSGPSSIIMADYCRSAAFALTAAALRAIASQEKG